MIYRNTTIMLELKRTFKRNMLSFVVLFEKKNCYGICYGILKHICDSIDINAPRFYSLDCLSGSYEYVWLHMFENIVGKNPGSVCNVFIVDSF